MLINKYKSMSMNKHNVTRAVLEIDSIGVNCVCLLKLN